MDKILELKEINYSFQLGTNSLQILKNVNMCADDGEFITIVGKSGSGKSTLLNIIAGFSKPSSGVISILGTETNKLNENKMAIFRQKNIGFIFQAYNLIQTMTALENIQLPLELSGEDRKIRYKKAREIIKLLGLEEREDHYPNELSGGEQQRVGIGRAIIANPKIILADEPTGNLDSSTEIQIINYLLKINKELKTTLILVTHDLEIAEKADRIIQIKDGRVF